MNDWKPIDATEPKMDEVVLTKIVDEKGERNEQELKRGGQYGNLWFFPDDSMYVYYTPTHYRPLDEATLRQREERRRLAQETYDALTPAQREAMGVRAPGKY